MLRKILERIHLVQNKTPDDYALPWGMTHGDYVAMQRLARSEDFEAWRKTIDNVVTYYAESMLNEDDTSRLHYLRGKVAGARYALEIVDEILHNEQETLNARRRAELAINPTRSRSSTYGTPLWNPDNS